MNEQNRRFLAHIDELENNLHRDIMNLPFERSALDLTRHDVQSAKIGHKEARHKAVEILLKEIQQLKEKYIEKT